MSCGGYLVIDYTEAMTVIDVNSGRYSGRENLEETIMQINREAAVEIARQLRLRDIGGIIVVDFIDMHTQEHQQEILQVLQQALSNDKMKPRVQDITVLNLVEITRKKLARIFQRFCMPPVLSVRGWQSTITRNSSLGNKTAFADFTG